MKKIIYLFVLTLLPFGAKSTIHEILVWDGYMQFLPSSLEVQLGDTIQWLPLDNPTMVHTVTSSNIPNGAVEFDVIWQAPADVFFQYIPAVVGLYEYVCTPHIQYDMIGSFNVVEAAAGMVESEQNDFTIYPNPASDILFIKTIEQKVNYKLWTQSGTQVGEGMGSDKIDISKLSKGCYFLEIIGIRPRVFCFSKE
ncbi:T9SS type A sorting domain-containing protein [Crocinitomicaceae bacterium]|nr:T9SS type A sorting domain-containing protein [Crocinitomicaceae bacterium]